LSARSSQCQSKITSGTESTKESGPAPGSLFSKLDTQLTTASIYASTLTSRGTYKTRGQRGQNGVTSPFLQNSFVPYHLPVYPGTRLSRYAKRLESEKCLTNSRKKARLAAQFPEFIFHLAPESGGRHSERLAKQRTHVLNRLNTRSGSNLFE